MAEFLQNFSLFPLVLTFGAYQFGLWCQKKWKSPLFNPILIASLLAIGALLLTGYPNESYQANMTGISWLLTPATVCLALPLYCHLHLLKKRIPAICQYAFKRFIREVVKISQNPSDLCSSGGEKVMDVGR